MIEAMADRRLRARGIERPPEVSDEAAKKMDQRLQRKLAEGFGRKAKAIEAPAERT